MNESIRVREVRAVFPDGTTEVMPTSAALRKAQELGLDLVLIAPTAVPPVAKAVDFGHYQYDLKKKQHDARKKQHVVQVKELKFRPNTDDHDYDFKKNHAIRFLTEGNRVKAVVQFRGREIAHADLGKKLLMRFAADLTAYGTVEGMPRLEGRNAHVLISPVKAAVAKPEKSEKPEKHEKTEKPEKSDKPAPPPATSAHSGAFGRSRTFGVRAYPFGHDKIRSALPFTAGFLSGACSGEHVQRLLRLHQKPVQHEPGPLVSVPEPAARGSARQPDLWGAEP